MSEEVLVWNHELAMSLLIIDVFLVAYVVFGVLGNLMIIYIYNVRLKVKLDDRIFILALATVDIIVCVTGPAFALTRNILPVAFQGNTVCKLIWFVTKAMNAVSVFLVLVIGVQRYLKICRPFGVQMNNKSKKIIIAGCVIVCFVGHAPVFIFYGEIPVASVSRNITGSRCGRIHAGDSNIGRDGYIYLLVIFVMAVGTLSLIALLYTLIGRRIYKRIKYRDRTGSTTYQIADTDPASERMSMDGKDVSTAKDSSNSRASNNPSNLPVAVAHKSRPSRRRSSVSSVKNWKEKHRYSIMFLLISGICVVTYIPTLVVTLAVNLDSVEFWNYTSPRLRELSLYLFQVYIVNHVVNPFVYGFFDSAFRREIKYVLCRKK